MEKRNLLLIPDEYTIIDLETTGINPHINHIIEIGCIKIKNDREVARFETLLKAPHKLSSRIKKLTGITDDMLAKAPSFEEIAIELWNFLKDEIVVGHNVNFDINFLYKNFQRTLNIEFENEYIDSLKICRKYYPGLKSYSLEKICDELGIKEKNHRAISDCLIVKTIFEKIHKQKIGEKIMSVVLKKGQKVNLTKDNPKLKNILIGLGWDLSDQINEFDLDTSVFLLGADGKVTSEDDFIFYNNLKHKSESVEHLGDNLKGSGEGDDEQVKIDLSKIPAQIEKIDFVITIYESEERKQNFGQLKKAYIRVIDLDRNKEIIRYDLGKEFSVETAIVAAEIYRSKGEWKFQALGSGFIGGLEALSRNYGINSGRKSDRASIVMYSDVKIAVKKLAIIHQVKISDIINDALEKYIQDHNEEINKYDNVIKNI